MYRKFGEEWMTRHQNRPQMTKDIEEAGLEFINKIYNVFNTFAKTEKEASYFLAQFQSKLARCKEVANSIQSTAQNSQLAVEDKIMTVQKTVEQTLGFLVPNCEANSLTNCVDEGVYATTPANTMQPNQGEYAAFFQNFDPDLLTAPIINTSVPPTENNQYCGTPQNSLNTFQN